MNGLSRRQVISGVWAASGGVVLGVPAVSAAPLPRWLLLPPLSYRQFHMHLPGRAPVAADLLGDDIAFDRDGWGTTQARLPIEPGGRLPLLALGLLLGNPFLCVAESQRVNEHDLDQPTVTRTRCNLLGCRVTSYSFVWGDGPATTDRCPQAVVLTLRPQTVEFERLPPLGHFVADA